MTPEHMMIIDLLKWGLPLLCAVVLWLGRLEWVGRTNKAAAIEHKAQHEKDLAAHAAIIERMQDRERDLRDRTTNTEARLETVYLWMAEIKQFITRESK